MIDVELTEQARAVVEERRAAELAAEIAQEAANLAHRAAQAATGQQMIESQTRIKQEKVARHAQARALARHHKEHWAELTQAREQIESKIGFLKADAEAARKAAFKCAEPDPETYPTDEEIAAHKATRRQLDEAVFRLESMIATQDRILADAQQREWEAEDRFKEAKRFEWERRSEL
jgi:hypothetical protein